VERVYLSLLALITQLLLVAAELQLAGQIILLLMVVMEIYHQLQGQRLFLQFLQLVVAAVLLM
jgi:hypothetical protein